MTRLVLAENSPHNSESRLIGGSLRELHRKLPDAWAVVTYADQMAGHLGYVYQATNAIYTGLSSREPSYILSDGRSRSPRNKSPRGTGRINREEAASFGWQVIEGQPKHRYVYILGNRSERRQRRALLKLPVLPYPKATVA